MNKAILLVVLLVCGCAENHNVVPSKPKFDVSFSKSDITHQQFSADNAECNAQAAPFLNEDAVFFVMQKKLCMEGKGYKCLINGNPCK